MTTVKNRIPLIAPALLAAAYVSFYHMPTFCEKAAEPPVASEAEAAPAEAGDGGWYVINSGQMAIMCQSDVDIKSVERRLGGGGLFSSGVYGPNPTSVPSEKVAYRMDRLLKRAKELLDMYPNMPGLKVKVYKTREDLADEYVKTFGSAPEDLKSFYVYQHDIIYTCEREISASVIAHEMGHAIIDHYFSAVPPTRIAELMASYVDLHLEDDISDL